MGRAGGAEGGVTTHMSSFPSSPHLTFPPNRQEPAADKSKDVRGCKWASERDGKEGR